MKTGTSPVIGILAFQGGVVEHENILKSLKVKTLLVRDGKDLERVNGLIIPGGESTVIGFFLENTGMRSRIKELASKDFPLFGTCAGAILLAKKIISAKEPYHLSLLDIEIERNAYGNQGESFYAELNAENIGIKKLKAAFIRAPIIRKTGTNVRILASHEGKPVLVQEKNILAATFHPELRNETSLHEYFLHIAAM